jgi:subtilisin-like proprotein convertase family protein
MLKIETFTIVLDVNHLAQQELTVKLSNPDNFGIGEIWTGATVLYNGEGSGQFGRKIFNITQYNGRILSGWKFDIGIIDNINNSNNGSVTTFEVEINRDKCLNRPCYDDNDCPVSNQKCHTTQKKCVLK